MVRLGDIIFREILKRGYKNWREFCLESGIDQGDISRANKNNEWTPLMLSRIDECLCTNFKKFANAKGR